MARYAVFTDLDGTLLDHETYEFDAAVPLIRALRKVGIPVFSVSSKTLAEQQALFDALGLMDGYVGENGGVVSHQGQIHVLGPGAADIERARQAIEKELGRTVPSFKPEHIDLVMQTTGLPRQSAMLACQRECSNPLILEVTEQQVTQLETVIDTNRTRLVRGGRFLTLCGHADKAKAMRFLVDRHFAGATDIKTIALGDSANDVPMLLAADYGILMPNSKGSGVPSTIKDQLIVANQPGPVGWTRVVIDSLGRLGVTVS
ncbi:MAG: HAD-IIB family hydrolase [Limnobacter sp.]|nr:HAD-IIB family hydrolase [Limnobacter sp.]